MAFQFDTSTRARLERLLAIAVRKQRAARLLWTDGQTAQAYGLAVEALEDLLSGLSAPEPGGPVEHGRPAPLEQACDPEDLRLCASTLEETKTLAMPALDTDFGGAHAVLIERVWQGHERLRRSLERTLEVVPRRRWLLLALLLLVVGAGVLAARAGGAVSARASASYSSEHDASSAVDGLDATEWLLPDGKTGWIELKLERPKQVREVRLLNAHNRHYNDRATRKYEVELYDGDRLHATLTGEFEKLEAEPVPRPLAVPKGRVTRVRVSVLSHFGSGGGFAEIALR